MNIENLTILRNFLQTVPESNFNHSIWTGWTDEEAKIEVEGKHICGTTACIGGWAAIVGKLAPYQLTSAGEVYFTDTRTNFFGLGKTWLGLEDDQATILFAPFDLSEEEFESEEIYEELCEGRALSGDTTVAEAVQFLDRMIETGDANVMWWHEFKKVAD